MKNIFFPFLLSPEPGEGGGGADDKNPDGTPKTPNDKQPTEAEKERDRLLTENAEVRKQKKAAEDEKQKLADEIAALKKAGAKGQGDWQKVAEQLETEVTTLKTRNTMLTEGFKNTLTSSRLREEALKAGAKPDMVDLIDSMEFSEIEFSLDETSLRFNLKGTDVAIANLKKTRPSFFGAAPAPKFNKGGPSGQETPQGLQEAKTAYIAAMKTRYKDPVGFEKATKAYQDAVFEARKAKK